MLGGMLQGYVGILFRDWFLLTTKVSPILEKPSLASGFFTLHEARRICFVVGDMAKPAKMMAQINSELSHLPKLTKKQELQQPTNQPKTSNHLPEKVDLENLDPPKKNSKHPITSGGICLDVYKVGPY